MKIKNSLPFLITIEGDFGIATGSSPASLAWLKSEAAFKGISSGRIDFKCHTGAQVDIWYGNVRRPDNHEIISNLNRYPILKEYSINMGYVKEVSQLSSI